MVVDRSWKCVCGNRNDGLFCASCGEMEQPPSGNAFGDIVTDKKTRRVTVCYCDTKYVCPFCKGYTTIWEHQFIDHVLQKHLKETLAKMAKAYASTRLSRESRFRKPDPEKRCTCSHEDD